MPVVVSDASVLICLGAVNLLDLLKTLYAEIVVPNAVLQEVLVAASSRPGAQYRRADSGNQVTDYQDLLMINAPPAHSLATRD